MDLTPTQRLAEALGVDLADFIASRRPARSWRLIARDLRDATDGQVDVTPETLRNWYGQQAQQQAGVA